jgi:hypothetical protein
MSRTRAKFDNGTLGYRYGEETVMRLSPVEFIEDFIGANNGAGFPGKYIAAENTTSLWRTTETNLNLAIASVANASGGVVQITADADDNAELGLLAFNDSLLFRLNEGLVFECRAALQVLPTTVGGELTTVLMGLASATAAVPDNVAVNAWFRLEGAGAGAVLWETDDNVAVDDDDNATGVSVVATVYHYYRIDCTDWTTPKFYIDGVLVGTGNMAALAAPSVQPYFRVDKQLAANNTSIGTLYLDYVRVWQNRS